MSDSKRRSYVNHLVNVYKVRGRKNLVEVQALHRELRTMDHGYDDNDPPEPIVLRDTEIAEIVHHAYYRSAHDWAAIAGPKDVSNLAHFLGRG